MRLYALLTVTLILIATSTAFSNSPPPTWNPFSPYTGYLGDIDEVQIGFGDWCTLDEGPHPGIDFGDPDQNNGTQVYSPCGTSGTVEWAGYYIDPSPSDNKGMLVCVAKPGEDWSWGVAHLDPGAYPPQYGIGGVQPAFAPMEITFDMSQSNPDWRHVHFYWIHRNPATQWDLGFYNPFNYIMGNLVGYDAVSFGSPQYVEDSSLPDNGIYFSPDEAEHPLQFEITAMNWMDFQEIVFGKVDVSVRPYSAYQCDLSNDTCGVNTIGYKILWQNPYTEGYEDLDESSISIFGGVYRLLLSMNDGEMNVGDSDEYRAVYLDGNVVGSGDPQSWQGFNSSYIVTNSGTHSMGSGDDGFNSGWDNVWTDSYDRDADWNDQEYLRGAWDTRLGNSDSNKTASINEQAFFPDGRYAFAVRALSQGTAFLDPVHQEWSERVLPCEDPLNENSSVIGIVVDNFIPSIEEIIVYSYFLTQLPGRADTMYTEKWSVEDSTSRVRDSTAAYSYLPSVGNGLGIAVRYSEIIDPENMGYYWFTGEWGEEEVYSTEDDKSRWLMPVERFRNGLGIVPSSPEAAYWQCYETRSDCSIDEIGYVGRLAIHIGGQSVLLTALDLAGNEMDHDPSSIADPRDPTTGQFDYSEVESGPYDTERWGTPNYSKAASGVFLGSVLDQEFTVTPEVDGFLVGDCPYWCGFWLEEYQELPTSELIVDVVKPDESYLSATLYPGGDTCGVWDESLSIDSLEGRYGWFVWGTSVTWPENPDVKDIHIRATVVDSEDISTAITYDLGVGQSYPALTYTTNSDIDGPWTVCTARIIKVYEEGSVDIERMYTYYPSGGLIDTVHCEPPSTLNHNQHRLSDFNNACDISVVNTFEFTVGTAWPNPASASVVIPFSLTESKPVIIHVFDITGRIVQSISIENPNAGNNTFFWDTTDEHTSRVPSGIYSVRIVSGDLSGSTNIVVIR